MYNFIVNSSQVIVNSARCFGRCATLLLIATSSMTCAITPERSTDGLTQSHTIQRTDLEVQALVMQLADEYIAAMGEACYLMLAEAKDDPRARWLIQSFLRNGVGAAIDIATGPNPDVALLDLLVVSSLQTWSFEIHWIPAGIDPETGAIATARLKEAERNLWQAASRIVDDEDQQTLRGLIDAWVQANPDRTVVAFVRFEEFTDARRSPADRRTHAASLLRELDQASTAVDNARLLGERLIWFAGRYPFVLGEQAELTSYRIADQPEMRNLAATLDEFRQLSHALAERSNALPDDVAAAVKRLEESVGRLSASTVEHTFDRLADERKALLDDIQAREGDLRGVLQDLEKTIEVSTGLAHELTGTVNAIDHVVRRFDREDGETREPLDMKDVRDAAVETGKAAEKLTALLEQTNQTLDSAALDQRLKTLETMSNNRVDRAFYRGLLLIGVLIAGLAAIRLIRRNANMAEPKHA